MIAIGRCLVYASWSSSGVLARATSSILLLTHARSEWTPCTLAPSSRTCLALCSPLCSGLHLDLCWPLNRFIVFTYMTVVPLLHLIVIGRPLIHMSLYLSCLHLVPTFPNPSVFCPETHSALASLDAMLPSPAYRSSSNPEPFFRFPVYSSLFVDLHVVEWHCHDQNEEVGWPGYDMARNACRFVLR